MNSNEYNSLSNEEIIEQAKQIILSSKHNEISPPDFRMNTQNINQLALIERYNEKVIVYEESINKGFPYLEINLMNHTSRMFPSHISLNKENN